MTPSVGRTPDAVEGAGGVVEGGARQRVLVILFGILLLCAFAPTLLSFPETWNQGRVHGYVAAALATWLAWANRASILKQGKDGQLLGIVAVIASSVLWATGTIAGLRVVHQIAFLGLLLAWSLSHSSSSGFRRALEVTAVATLALPVWEVLLRPLQLMTVSVNGLAVSLSGIPATLDGERIVFPFGIIEVAESCAGLSYFMSALTIGVAYGSLFLRHSKAKVVAILLACSLAVVSNWIRVFGLVLVGYKTQMTSPLMAEHATYGWLIFACTMIVFFAAAKRIERLDASFGSATALTPHSGGLSPLTPPLRLGRKSFLVFLGPVLVVLGLAIGSTEAIPASVRGISPSGWTIRSVDSGKSRSSGIGPVSWWVPRFAGFSNSLISYYLRAGDTVRVDRLIYSAQHQGREMIGDGNTLEGSENIVAHGMAGPLDQSFRVVNQAIVRHDTGFYAVWYWYIVGDWETPSPLRAKLFEVPNFFLRKPPSEIVVVSTPCGVDSCRLAVERLGSLVVGGRPLAR